jgi:hypothetical protein
VGIDVPFPSFRHRKVISGNAIRLCAVVGLGAGLEFFDVELAFGVALKTC